MLVFSEKFAYALNEWSHRKLQHFQARCVFKTQSTIYDEATFQ